MAANVLLILLLILTGCASTPYERVIATKCEQPELRGDTWADLAILAAEQRAAIESCNVANSHLFAEATVGHVTPKPETCRLSGVDVQDDAEVTGFIARATKHPKGKAHLHCDALTVHTIGCTRRIAHGIYEIHYEPNLWIYIHEVCHAKYEEADHTAEYKAERGMK